MNKSDLSEFENKDSDKYKTLLESGSVGTLIAGRNVSVINSETLKQGDFVRCKILNPGGSYWLAARFLDIPIINLQKAINGKDVGSSIRAIGKDGLFSGGPIEGQGAIHIESYDIDTHTINTSGNYGANFKVEIPVIFSDNKEYFEYDNTIKSVEMTENQKENVIEEREKLNKKLMSFMNE